MGAFNRLLVEHQCARCGSTVERAFQFKYGHKWQDDYRIGDRLDWGGNDEGTPGLEWVNVWWAAAVAAVMLLVCHRPVRRWLHYARRERERERLNGTDDDPWA